MSVFRRPTREQEAQRSATPLSLLPMALTKPLLIVPLAHSVQPPLPKRQNPMVSYAQVLESYKV